MYERTYHKAVLKTDDKPVKKEGGRVNWKAALWIVVSVAIVVGAVFLIRMPRLQVTNVEVAGAHVADPGDVKEFVMTELQGKKLFLLPKTSIFLVPEHRLEKDLKAQFSRFQTVSVSRKNFSTLVVTVSEYQGVYLWCSDDASCYFMDQNGVAFAPAPYFSGNAYPKIFVGQKQGLPFQAVTASQLAFIAAALDKLPVIGINPEEFHFVSDHELDVYFNHYGQQSKLLFDPTTNLQDAMNALYTGLRTNPLATKFRDQTQILQYVDLRFSYRVVYKFQ